MIAGKKSQTEVLGFAIVVVIILLGVFFFARNGFRPQAKFRDDFVSSELASNMINTFSKTTSADCRQLTMTELLQDCAQGGSIKCNDAAGSTSCQYVSSAASSIFAQTFVKWGRSYHFIAYVDVNSPKIDIGKPSCNGQKSKLYPIPISGGTMYTRIDLCT